MTDSDSGKFWFCVKDHRVETGEDLCPPIDRLGPYATREEAERALITARERTEAWDEEDRRWEEGGRESES